MTTLLKLSVFLVFAIIANACNSGENNNQKSDDISQDVNSRISGDNHPDYKSTSTGLLYKFHVKTDGENPVIGDILTLDMFYKDEEENVYMDTRMTGNPAIMGLIESEYEGDIYEAFAMLAVGDSVSFIIDGYKFIRITAKVPEGEMENVKPGSKMFFEVKLHDIQSEAEYEQEVMAQMEKQTEEHDRAYREEQKKFMEYLSEHNITTEPTMSGLIFIEKEKGSGPIVEAGQTLTVDYTGMLLDGTVFDCSITRGNPIEFVVGRGQVIQGWDEGLQLMNVGGKARLIIPSFLAYSDQGAGNVIPPFSTLIFDVEVIDAN